LHSHGNTNAFVNVQHVQLWVNHRIAAFNFADKPLDQQIAWLKDNFEAVFNSAQQQITAVEDSSKSKQHEHNEIQAIIKMAHDEKQAGLLIEAVVTLSNELILKYLRNHSEQKELAISHDYFICHDSFKQIIKILDDASNHQEMAKQFKEAIEKGLTTNLDQHCRALFAQSQGLLHESVLLISTSHDADAATEDERFALHNQQKSWFVNTECLLGELAILARQIDILSPYCQQDSLIASLSVLTNSQLYNYTSDGLSRAVHRSIEQTITLLHNHAAQMLVNNPLLLNNRPQGMTSEFFQHMRKLARGLAAELAEDIDAKKTAKLVTDDLNKSQESIIRLQQLFADAQRQNQQDSNAAAEHSAQLTTALQNEREQHKLDNDAAVQQHTLLSKDINEQQQEHRQAQDIARKNIDSLNKQIANWQNPVEQHHSVSLVALQAKTNAYLLHLQGQKTDSDLLKSKKEIIVNLKTILDDATVLPSLRLQQFTEALHEKRQQQTIRSHRDSAWLRFVRDCIRIIAVAVSGLGVYRVLTGSPAQFFRPSHGETFLDDVDLTIKPSNK
ncbi:MAG: hypothetical protein ACRC0M_04880, partial [Legionella sp.]